MRISIVGAGTLGRVYGQRLAAVGEDVSFVVRPGRVDDTSPFIIEQVNGTRRRDVVERPARVTAVPSGTEIVILAVRFEQLDGSADLAALLAPARAAPIVVLTPLMPKQRKALFAALGRPITPAMPSVSGYIDER